MSRTSPMNWKKLSAIALLGMTSAFGCMVDDSGDTPATGGTGGATGGTGGTAMAGSGGTAMAGAGGTAATCTPNPVAQVCGGFVAPAWGTPPGMTAGKLLDFASYMTDGKWGSMASGELTGGTSLYHGPSDVDLTRVVESGALRITATITPTGYVGIVFWFGPCVNASAFTGIDFAVGGVTGGAVLKAQVQTHEDYPVDVANMKGGCSFTNCDEKFTECAGPTHQVVVPAVPETLNLPWSSFAGGTPNADVTPEGLVGLQFQLECQSDAACVVDLTLGDIGFTI
jgi:hypothetical protein